MNLAEELKNLVVALGDENVQYALCGGLAMAVHGYPRATMDIDLWAHSANEVARIKTIAKRLGFEFSADPMLLHEGKVIIHRVSKIHNHDFLLLDIIEFNELKDKVIKIENNNWEGIALPVIDKETLILTKKYRHSEQDRADIENLQRK